MVNRLNEELKVKLFFLKAFLNIPTTRAVREIILSSCSWRRIAEIKMSLTDEQPTQLGYETDIDRAFTSLLEMHE